MKDQVFYIDDFSGGMVERIKQDVPQQGQQQSVKFLMNFRPDVETRSLVVRGGLKHYRVPHVDYTDYMTNSSTDSQNVLSVLSVLQADPLAMATYHVFLKNPEADLSGGFNQLDQTRLLGWYGKEGGSFGWYQPRVDGNPFAGIKTWGTLKDWKKKGQQIIFTNLLEDSDWSLHKDLEEYEVAPLYVYRFYDYRTLTDNPEMPYFNGADFSGIDAEEAQLWKVDKGFNQIKRLVGQSSVLMPKSPAGETLASQMEGASGSDALTGSFDQKNVHRSGDFSKLVDVVFWQDDVFPEGHDADPDCYKNGYADFGNTSLEPIYPGGKEMVPYERGFTATVNTKWTNNTLPTLPVYVPCSRVKTDVIAWAREGAEKWDQDMYLLGTKGHITANGLYPNTGGKDNKNVFTEVGTLTAGIDLDNASESELLLAATSSFTADKFDDNPDGTVNPEYLDKFNLGAVGFHWEDYGKHNFPRKWIKNEEIPWILTAVIDGVEVIIKRDTYTVKGGLDAKGFTNEDPVYVQNASAAFGYTVPVGQARSYNPHVGVLPSADMQIFDWRSHNTGTNKPEFLSVENMMVGELSSRANEGDEFDPEKYCPLRAKSEGYNVWIRKYKPFSRLPFVKFTLRLNASSVEQLASSLPMGLTEFKLYVSQPDPQEGQAHPGLNLYGDEMDQSNYRYPLARKDKDFDFKHVKTFRIRGESDEMSEGQAERFARTDQGRVGAATNNWFYYGGTDQDTYHDMTTDFSSRGFYCAPETVDSVPLASGGWDASFYLWDYAMAGESLVDAVGAEGLEYWEGRGANALVNVKGLNVLLDPVEMDGNREVGAIRYALRQNGVFANDVFPKINKILLGNESFVAGVSFRDQVWAFTRTSVHRIVFHDIFNSDSWEVLDTIEGQGTFDTKSVVETPYGVVWANENGVWFSDGRDPQNLIGSNQELYRYLVAGTEHRYGVKTVVEGRYLNDNKGFNDKIELIYDDSINGLRVMLRGWEKGESAVVPDYVRVHLVYSFDIKAWHSESYQSYETGMASPAVCDDGVHKMSFVSPQTGDGTDSDLDYNGRRLVQARVVGDELSFACLDHSSAEDTYETSDETPIEYSFDMDVEVQLHEMGDGVNDFCVRRAELEMTPISDSEGWATNKPSLNIEMRSKGYVQVSESGSTLDLTKVNAAPKGNTFWLTNMNTPNDTSVPRESFTLNAPFHFNREEDDARVTNMFRRASVTLKAGGVAVLRSIQIQLKRFRRKHYG